MANTKVAWSQIIGTRASQQDHASILSWPNGFRLFLLADGMGGHNAGDIASQSVINAFREHFVSSVETDMRKRMLDALAHSNNTLRKIIIEKPETEGMGTTLLAVIYDGISVQWLSVGDSPIWLIRGNEIKRINQNHSMATVLAEKVSQGAITEEEAAHSPLRSQLLEAVMGEEIEMIDAPESTIEIEAGDWIILASDGVESCSLDNILAISQSVPGEPQEFVTKLLTNIQAQERTSQDNASVVAMCVEQDEMVEPTTFEPQSGDQFEEPRTQF